MFRAIAIRFRCAAGTRHIQQTRWNSSLSRPRPMVQDPSKYFEEESHPYYEAEEWYPVHIGEIFESRYKVVGKLGHNWRGAIWLCRDMRTSEFVSIKVCIDTGNPTSSGDNNDILAFKQMAKFGFEHEGAAYVQRLLDTFKLQGSDRTHICLVYQPMHTSLKSLWEGRHYMKGSKSMVHSVVRNLLHALVYLHEEAGITHTNIDSRNIMFTVKDLTILEEFEKAELDDPLPAKVIDASRTIYSSRKLRLTDQHQLGYPVLCNFCDSRIGEHQTGRLQPARFRSPEGIFDLSWTYKTDIWNLGVFMWELIEGKRLFNIKDDENWCPKYGTGYDDFDGYDDDENEVGGLVDEEIYQTAEIIAYLGHPRLDYIMSGDNTRVFFDANGKWKNPFGVRVPQTSFEDATKSFHGAEEKVEFLEFLKMMLQWVPEHRASARQLLASSYMQSRSHM